MRDRVAGKVAIVTGGARGQGVAHGRLLGQEGARVVLADVRDEEGTAAAETLRDEGLDVAFLHLDVTSEVNWREVCTRTEQVYGRIDALVNNAGMVGTAAGTIDETLEDWSRVIAVNQTGVFLGMKHAITAMRKVTGGSIINISSIWGLAGAPDRIAYQASKGAVTMMTKSAAITYASEHIRVNAVVPGSVQTQFGPERPLRTSNNTLAMTPMGRRARPEEVSFAVLYLASDESAFVTGTDLVVDGGYLAQ